MAKPVISGTPIPLGFTTTIRPPGQTSRTLGFLSGRNLKFPGGANNINNNDDSDDSDQGRIYTQRKMCGGGEVAIGLRYENYVKKNNVIKNI